MTDVSDYYLKINGRPILQDVCWADAKKLSECSTSIFLWKELIIFSSACHSKYECSGLVLKILIKLKKIYWWYTDNLSSIQFKNLWMHLTTVESFVWTPPIRSINIGVLRQCFKFMIESWRFKRFKLKEFSINFPNRVIKALDSRVRNRMRFFRIRSISSLVYMRLKWIF